jgi:signal transduction histidine kinase/CheY-like chemotaxis protein/AraC-like DNA-binding protein
LNIKTQIISKTPYELYNDFVISIEEDKDILWIGTQTGGVTRINKAKQNFLHFKKTENPNSLTSALIRGIIEDKTQNIWAGTNNGGVNVLKRKNTNISSLYVSKHYQHNSTSKNSISSNSIYPIIEDSQGDIWIGTYGYGLNRFSHDKFQVFNFNESDTNSLSENRIHALAEDTTHLFIGTMGGALSVYNKHTKKFKRYSSHPVNPYQFDGLQSDEFNLGSYASTADGYFIFGGVNGLTIFHPDSLVFNSNHAKIIITDLTVLNTPIKPLTKNPHNIHIEEDISQLKKIELKHNLNIINLEFSAMDFVNPIKNQYAYKLDGFNKDWVYSGNKRSVTYTNLDPGKYTFRVKASNNDGLWSAYETTLIIIILPPPWRTWWAYSLYILTFTMLLLSARNEVIKRERLKSKVKLKEIEAEKYQELNTLKSRIFTNISHEFRTPLTLILTPLQKRLELATTTEDKVELTLMQRNAQRLLTLVNQLLDLSRLEAGTLKLKCTNEDLIIITQRIASQFLSMATSKNIQFEVDAESSIYLTCDVEKFENILTNLLSNAFKFTPSVGSILIYIRKKDSSTKFPFGFVEIQVYDSGPGIKKEHQDKIFNRFYQVDDSTTREFEGSGIGLALTKELIELHGGTIEVTSEYGKGTTFIIRLPLGQSRETQKTTQPEVIHLNHSQPEPDIYFNEEVTAESILIIEDNSDLRLYLKNELKSSYTILEGSNGEEGFTLAIEKIPTLIISDLMMPKRDGLQLCEMIKTDARTSHIPFILLTAKSDIKVKLEGLTLGADDYVAKPFNMQELQVRIKNLIENRKRLQQKYGNQLSLRPTEIQVESMDDRFIKTAMEVVERHIADTSFGVEQFAEEVALSQAQLYRKLKAITNFTPNEFIRHMRLERAADLLKKHAGNVADVSYQVGFNNLSYFAKCFKEKFGVPPSQFTG